MKRAIQILFIIIFAAVSNSFGQWTKISEVNIGVTGQTAADGSHVYFYGSQQGAKLYRVDENGENFTDLSGGIGDGFSFIGEFYGKLYGCWLSSIYTSEDNGVTWNVLSTVSVTGNGAVMRLVNDGGTLYGVSNRKSIFKSTDMGKTWTEIIINDPNNLALANLAVVGDTYIAVVLNSGTWVSKDAGQTWTINNPTASIGITSVYNFNGTIIGESFNGIYVYDFNTDKWIASSNGLPADGVFYITRSLTSRGGILYLGGSQLIGSTSSVYTSSDGGSSWNAVNMEGLATTNGAGSVSFVAGSSKNIFCFYYGVLDAKNTGIYKTEFSNVTSVKQIDEIPSGFSLSQNYPNPFNPATKINFSIDKSGPASLKVFNALGQEVSQLINENLSAGKYSIDFKAAELSSGIYFYTLTSNKNIQTKKMLLVK